jgi:hypothetical protein
MMKQHVPITSEISHEELTSILHNWNKYQVVTVLESYQELSKRTLQTPSLLSILVEIKIQKNVSKFCQANQFYRIEDFIESYNESHKAQVDPNKDNTPDEFGLCWV